MMRQIFKQCTKEIIRKGWRKAEKLADLTEFGV